MAQRKPVWLARFGATILVLAVGLPVAAGEDAPRAEAFARLKPGKTKRDQVYKAVGQPAREYSRSSPAGSTPVYVTYSPPDHDTGLVGSDDPFTAPHETAVTATPVESPRFVGAAEFVTVLEYPPGEGSQSYYVVLKDDVVLYAIAPVPRDEVELKAVQHKYGKTAPDFERSPYLPDHEREVEIYAYPKAQVAFLRTKGTQRFTAKVIGFTRSR